MPPATAIRAIELTRHYGATVGIDGLDLEVEAGEVFGFLGPNGSGKTTTIRLLLDLIRPTRGRALLFGRPTRNPDVRDRIGYLPGELVLDERLTGRKTLDLLDALRTAGRPPADPRRIAELCERIGLSDGELDRRTREYSRGMKQKLGLVSAMMHDPDLLILDEPTTGLDPLVREAVFALLLEAGRAGKTVFHSSHVLTEVDRTCTRVGIVREGRLVALLDSAEIRRSSVRRMEVRFSSAPPVDELQLPGVRVVEVRGSFVALRVSGELDPLLRVLARHPVKDLVFPESSLEEAFADYYRSPAVEEPS